jgi:hypothetical protein
MTSAKIGHTERALGAILNLTRYKPPMTIEEANVRLHLIDQIALTALTSVGKVLPVSGGSRSSTWRYSEQPRMPGQSRLQKITSKAPLQSMTHTTKKHNSISNQRLRQHDSAS